MTHNKIMVKQDDEFELTMDKSKMEVRKLKNSAIYNARLTNYEISLKEAEKSVHTIEKYLRDIRYFLNFVGDRALTKALAIDYKAYLGKYYAVSGANSMIAAMNSFLKFCGLEACCVKQFKLQKKAYCPEEQELSKQEYVMLVKAAEKKKNQRLSLVIQTICSTGIRVSELPFITVEAAKKGAATVSCKGKIRTIFIVSQLRNKLLKYAKENRIKTGIIFITKSGKPLNRSNIWKDMKLLCKVAGVNPKKVFPHNLRHLFARTFYQIEKDIAKLADILGHTSINTTRIYIVTTGAEHKRKMESMRLII